MTTSFLNFTQDADRDITNAPQDYHNFGKAAVRIKVYWTPPIIANPGLLAHSFNLIRRAGEILDKYTLRLDVQPTPASASAALYSIAEAMARKAARPVAALSAVLTATPVRWVADAVIDTAVDNYLQSKIAGTAVLKYSNAIPLPDAGNPSVEILRPLRALADPVTEENRLIAVFAPISGLPDGYTALFADWLPWVLIDPRDLSDDTTLLHEMGHACRLAHQQNDGIATMHDPHYRNVMSYLNEHDWLWGWQVDTIYDSYWCTGQRPQNWWDRRNALRPANHPFLWDND